MELMTRISATKPERTTYLICRHEARRKCKTSKHKLQHHRNINCDDKTTLLLHSSAERTGALQKEAVKVRAVALPVHGILHVAQGTGLG